MLRQTIRHALISTVLTALVVIPIFSLHLERSGIRTVIAPQWSTVLWACTLVFMVQMLRPWLGKLMPRLPWPQLPATTGRQRQVLMLIALMIAVSWPFFAGRNAVDIATRCASSARFFATSALAIKRSKVWVFVSI